MKKKEKKDILIEFVKRVDMNKQIQKLRESLFMFRETLKSLEQRQLIREFEYPELIDFRSNGLINYQEQIKYIKSCKELCLQRLRGLNSQKE